MTLMGQMDADRKLGNGESAIDPLSEDQLDQRSIEHREYPHSALTQKIIAAFFKVYNTLG